MVVDLQASSEIDHFSTSFYNKAIVNNANFWDNFGAKDQASRSFRDWIQSASASDASKYHIFGGLEWTHFTATQRWRVVTGLPSLSDGLKGPTESLDAMDLNNIAPHVDTPSTPTMPTCVVSSHFA
jgi:hypothetical protein